MVLSEKSKVATPSFLSKTAFTIFIVAILLGIEILVAWLSLSFLGYTQGSGHDGFQKPRFSSTEEASSQIMTEKLTIFHFQCLGYAFEASIRDGIDAYLNDPAFMNHESYIYFESTENVQYDKEPSVSC